MYVVEATQIEITARDGYVLAATLFAPKPSSPFAAPERVVVIGSATGVRRGLYEPYARFLAKHGSAVVTFDYRGVGGSLRGPITKSRATILDWGRLDYPAVLDWAAARYPGVALGLVGHSVGGQLLGMLDNVHRLDAAVTVAAQNAHFRRYPLRRALKYAGLWYVGVPVLTRVFSHFPAKLLKLGEDLPGGVARDWARFARHAAYLVDERGRPLTRGFETMRAPVLAFSFTDDHRALASNVEALHRRFERAEVTLRDVSPASVGAQAIGHVGFFLSTHRKTLWTESLEWLRRGDHAGKVSPVASC